MNTMRLRLKDVFVRALELTDDVDVTTIAYRCHPNWDSLGHMALVLAVEDEFGVELEPDHLIEMTDFEAVCTILRRTGGQ
jgi:acyl carrier protein